MSFYFWRTVFNLDSLERGTLRANGVHTLYIRYFDVDWAATDTAPVPLAPIRFDTAPVSYRVIPVVYIRERVFEKLPPDQVSSFAAKVYALVSRIDSSAAATGPGTSSALQPGPLRPQEIQFDCDWTEGTRAEYFAFLRAYRGLSRQILSATIRLHQVKFPGRTGIPPVDSGVLMYYNIGNIDGGDNRSIYEKRIADRYMPALPAYPLPLDVALPIFSWGIQIRENKAIRLLDNMNAGLFAGDTNFTLPGGNRVAADRARSGGNRFTAVHACFKEGYYFREGDQVKIESVPRADLREMVRSVNRYSNHRVGNLIFYDLDSNNLSQYDNDVFKEILDHID